MCMDYEIHAKILLDTKTHSSIIFFVYLYWIMHIIIFQNIPEYPDTFLFYNISEFNKLNIILN